jgi:hypothetical protein
LSGGSAAQSSNVECVFVGKFGALLDEGKASLGLRPHQPLDRFLCGFLIVRRPLAYCQMVQTLPTIIMQKIWGSVRYLP